MCSGVIDDLVETGGRKISKLHLDDRPHAFKSAADSRANDGVLADRRVNDAIGELLRQILGRLESAAKRADVLPVYEDPRIVGQGFGLRLANCFKVSDAHTNALIDSGNPR